MITVKEGIKKFVFNAPQMRKDLKETIIQIYKEAAREFFIATMNKVPLYTGMARSSMTELARWLTTVLRQPVEVKLDPLKRNDRWAQSRRALGPSLGTKPIYNGGFIQIFENQYGLSKIIFRWDSMVPHWMHLEDSTWPNNLNSPWKASAEGRKMFWNYVNIALKGLKGNKFRRLRGLKDYCSYGTDIGEEK